MANITMSPYRAGMNYLQPANTDDLEPVVGEEHVDGMSLLRVAPPLPELSAPESIFDFDMELDASMGSVSEPGRPYDFNGHWSPGAIPDHESYVGNDKTRPWQERSPWIRYDPGPRVQQFDADASLPPEPYHYQSENSRLTPSPRYINPACLISTLPPSHPMVFPAVIDVPPELPSLALPQLEWQ